MDEIDLVSHKVSLNNARLDTFTTYFAVNINSASANNNRDCLPKQITDNTGDRHKFVKCPLRPQKEDNNFYAVEWCQSKAASKEESDGLTVNFLVIQK